MHNTFLILHATEDEIYSSLSLPLSLSLPFFNSLTRLVLSHTHTHTHTRIRKPWRKRPVAERQFVEQVERDPFEARQHSRACVQHYRSCIGL